MERTIDLLHRPLTRFAGLDRGQAPIRTATNTRRIVYLVALVLWTISATMVAYAERLRDASTLVALYLTPTIVILLVWLAHVKVSRGLAVASIRATPFTPPASVLHYLMSELDYCYLRFAWFVTPLFVWRYTKRTLGTTTTATTIEQYATEIGALHGLPILDCDAKPHFRPSTPSILLSRRGPEGPLAVCQPGSVIVALTLAAEAVTGSGLLSYKFTDDGTATIQYDGNIYRGVPLVTTHIGLNYIETYWWGRTYNRVVTKLLSGMTATVLQVDSVFPRSFKPIVAPYVSRFQIINPVLPTRSVALVFDRGDETLVSIAHLNDSPCFELNLTKLAGAITRQAASTSTHDGTLSQALAGEDHADIFPICILISRALREGACLWHTDGTAGHQAVREVFVDAMPSYHYSAVNGVTVLDAHKHVAKVYCHELAVGGGVAAKSRENEAATIQFRIREVAASAVTPARYYPYIIDFIQAMTPSAPLVPDIEDEVNEEMDRPTQIAERAYSDRIYDLYMDVRDWVCAAFQKPETYAERKVPRNISTTPPGHKYTFARWQRALDRMCKKFVFWAPGKTQGIIYRGLHLLFSHARILHFFETDISKMDGSRNSTCASAEMLWKINCFTTLPEQVAGLVYGAIGGLSPSQPIPLGSVILRPRPDVETLKAFSENSELRTAYTAHDLKYNTGTSRMSGNNDTTGSNSFDTIMIEYIIGRELGLNHIEAFANLGMYSGDDGLSMPVPGVAADVQERMILATYAAFGYKVKVKMHERGDPCEFLGMMMPDICADPGCVYPVNRFLSRAHLVVVGQQAPIPLNLRARVTNWFYPPPSSEITVQQAMYNKCVGMLVTLNREGRRTPFLSDICEAFITGCIRSTPGGLPHLHKNLTCNYEDRYEWSQIDLDDPAPFPAMDDSALAELMATYSGMQLQSLSECVASYIENGIAPGSKPPVVVMLKEAEPLPFAVHQDGHVVGTVVPEQPPEDLRLPKSYYKIARIAIRLQKEALAQRLIAAAIDSASLRLEQQRRTMEVKTLLDAANARFLATAALELTEQANRRNRAHPSTATAPRLELRATDRRGVDLELADGVWSSTLTQSLLDSDIETDSELTTSLTSNLSAARSGGPTERITALPGRLPRTADLATDQAARRTRRGRRAARAGPIPTLDSVVVHHQHTTNVLRNA